MTIPGHSPHRIYRTGSAKVLSRSGTPAGDTPASAAELPTAGSLPWRRGALLLAVAPAPLAALAVFAPVPIARLAAPLTAAVLVAGIAGQVTHTGLFFVPA